jgi:hypothetical protein
MWIGGTGIDQKNVKKFFNLKFFTSFRVFGSGAVSRFNNKSGSGSMLMILGPQYVLRVRIRDLGSSAFLPMDPGSVMEKNSDP